MIGYSLLLPLEHPNLNPYHLPFEAISGYITVVLRQELPLATYNLGTHHYGDDVLGRVVLYRLFSLLQRDRKEIHYADNDS